MKKLIFLLITSLIVTQVSFSQYTFGTNVSTPRTLATFQSFDSLKGIKIPVVISDPIGAIGMDGSIVYHKIDSCFKMYNGRFWDCISQDTNRFWMLSGQPPVMTHKSSLLSGNPDTLVITDDGQIGVGTTRPLGKIHIANDKDLLLDSSFIVMKNGNVGIGTVSPSEKLQVTGKILSDSLQLVAGANFKYVLSSDAFGNASWADPDTLISINGGNGLTASGNEVDLGGALTQNTSISLFGNSMNIDLNTTGDFSITDASLPMFYARDNGMIGIGKTTPNFDLEIEKPGEATLLVTSMTSNARLWANATTGDALMYLRTYDEANAQSKYWKLFNDDADEHQFKITNRVGVGIPFFTIDTLGNVGVRTANPSGLFSVEGDKDAILDSVFTVKLSGDVGIGTISPNFKLDVRGNIGNNATLHHSDLRWKKNVQNIESPLENLLKVSGKKYEWRVDEFNTMEFPSGEHYGVIAQEIETIFPELVKTDKDGYKSVDYAHLTPILIEAIKEQNNIINELKNDIEEIKQLIKK